MAAADVWADFETVRHSIKQNTVDRLKQILQGINDEAGTMFHKSGKKQELIDRLTQQLDIWHTTNNVDKWTKAKSVIYQIRHTGSFTPSRMSGGAMSLSAPHNGYTAGNTKPLGYSASPGSSGIGRYDPYAPPRKATQSYGTSSSSSMPRTPIRFKPSPFFRIDRAVSNVVECPESANASDRKQQTVHFTLTADDIAKLNSHQPKHQLRLFCTSSMFYNNSPGTFRPSAGPCPIEFPPTCEVRVNNVQLSANLKGLKKKPGTAPPADLGRTVRLNSATSNRVEMVYVNSQQPTQSKKFYLVVMLVEVTSVDQLVDKLRKGKYRPSNEILSKMHSALQDDDDIISGSQKMSLKCPLSFMRINTPARSASCVHSQCFDATSWYSVMEQTTTWICPVCEKVLNTEDLIIDGYFDEILKSCPESVEDVIVEADGQWHTTDNKYASAIWKSQHPPKSSPAKAPPPPPSPSKQEEVEHTIPNGPDPVKAKAKAVEVFVLDSDDDDDEDVGRVQRELSLSQGSGSGPSNTSRTFNSNAGSSKGPSVSQGSGSQGASAAVIDLTLDSDEDEEPTPTPGPAPNARVEKRKAGDVHSPTEQIWKKSRLEPILPLTAQRNANGPNGHGMNGLASPASASPDPRSPYLPPNSSLRYPPPGPVLGPRSPSMNRLPSPPPRAQPFPVQTNGYHHNAFPGPLHRPGSGASSPRGGSYFTNGLPRPQPGSSSSNRWP